MKCAIQLVFNDENQNRINQLRKMLVVNGCHDEAVPINHVSLAEIEIEDNQLHIVESILEKFSKNHKPLNLVLSSVGSFMSNENVVFLTPTMTDDLITYNDELVKILAENNISCGKYYIKNNWQPHCTIAIRVTNNELFAGFKTLKENNILPMSVIGCAIDLMCFDPKPYKELMRFELK
jgi:2'-5' RNA ligase